MSLREVVGKVIIGCERWLGGEGEEEGGMEGELI